MSRPRPIRTTAMGAALQGVGGGLGWSLIPPLMKTIANELDLSHTMSGVVWGAVPVGIALASPIGGWLVDRYGPRRVAAVGMLVGGLACGLRAVVVGPWSLAAVMMLFGLHTGVVAPAVPKALAGHVPLERLGRATGLTVVAYSFGTAVTLLTTHSVLVPLFGGWRPLMVAAGVAMAAVGLLWLALISDRAVSAAHASLRATFALWRDADVRRLALMQFLLFGGYLALFGMLPRALIEAKVPIPSLSYALAAWLVAAGIANVAGPALSDRLGRRRPIMVAGTVVASASLLVMALLPPGQAMWVLIVAGFGGGAIAPLLFTVPIELASVGPTRAGAAMGLLMLVGQIGGFLLPVVSGMTLGSGGFAAMMVLLAVLHLALLFPALTLRETGAGTSQALPANPATEPAR